MHVATDTTVLEVFHGIHCVTLATGGGMLATLAWKPLAFLEQALAAAKGS